MPKAGTWKFVDTAVRGSQKIIVLTTGNSSELTAAFATAIAALTPTNNTTVVGYDPRGKPHRYRNNNP